VKNEYQTFFSGSLPTQNSTFLMSSGQHFKKEIFSKPYEHTKKEKGDMESKKIFF
jgi:hypothetical protein